MTKKQVQRGIERYVAESFPELRVSGDLLIRRDGPLLWGFAFERSQMNKHAFRLRAFAQLLSVPESDINFGVSRELGNFRINGNEEAAFTAAAREAREHGRGFLSLVNHCRGLIDNVVSVLPATTDPRLADEIRAHCLIFAGEYREAKRQLETLIDALSSPEVPFEQKFLERVQALQNALSDDPAEALALLDSWAAQTADTLKIGDRD